MNQEIKKLQATINKAESQIRALRSECRHAKVKTNPGASTDHCDRPDEYWTEFTCLNCGAMWDEDCDTGDVTRYNF